jgi:tRNA(fMet)-specific endonuclease VapC
MGWLLDTNSVVALFRHARSPLSLRVRRQKPGEIRLSAIVYHELYFGAFRSARAADNLARLDGLLLPVVDFDREDARVAGAIRAELARLGMPIGPYDVLIAGQAKARGLVLVSRNTREFSRIADLRVEDWEAA